MVPVGPPQSGERISGLLSAASLARGKVDTEEYCNYIAVIHMSLEFEWDAAKSRSNAKKHGITFDLAQTVFYDERARLVADPDHSDEEERFLLLGMCSEIRLLVVAHCYRESKDRIRIISARKATKIEARQYGDMI